MYNITKKEIAAELEKVTAGVYRARQDPKFVVTLSVHKGYRRWVVSYDGHTAYNDYETDLGWALYRFRQIGVCSECGKHSGTARLHDWKGRLGERRVCTRCRDDLNTIGSAMDRAANAARKAEVRFDLADRCVAIANRYGLGIEATMAVFAELEGAP